MKIDNSVLNIDYFNCYPQQIKGAWHIDGLSSLQARYTKKLLLSEITAFLILTFNRNVR